MLLAKIVDVNKSFYVTVCNLHTVNGMCNEEITQCRKLRGTHRWQLGSKTERSLAVSWPKQLGELRCNYNIVVISSIGTQFC